jgi:pimeloyl-ACP methyl ester carboxylesterase
MVLAALAGAAQAEGGAGALLESQPLDGAPDGATAYRIYYQSTGLHDEPIVVSGMVIVPQGSAADGTRPVVAWAHPTTGVVPRCAPSLARKRFQMIAGLHLMLARGFIVAATDYPGLGTPETHPYLVGESEGRAVLDSVRAARQLPGVGAGASFVVWGHSQGGQAALFTGLLAGSYAPDLKLLGVAAAAPATELSELMKADLDTSGGRNLTAMTLWSWQRVFHAPSDEVLDPAAVPVVDRLASECIESLFDMFERRITQRPLAHDFLVSDSFITREPWARLLQENTPGPLPASLPVFLAQGTDDQLVLPSVTSEYARRLCAFGEAVQFDRVPDTGHGFVAFRASDAAVAWIADRFAGRPAPSNCGAI